MLREKCGVLQFVPQDDVRQAEGKGAIGARADLEMDCGAFGE